MTNKKRRDFENCKTLDLIALKTRFKNKVAIEVESYGKPSGIKTTEAKYWVHILRKGNQTYARIILDVALLKRLCRKYKDNWQMVGDNKASRVILIPLKEILVYDENITKNN
jgi:hypothetical protein